MLVDVRVVEPPQLESPVDPMRGARAARLSAVISDALTRFGMARIPGLGTLSFSALSSLAQATDRLLVQN